MSDRLTVPQVRASLYALRQMWAQHSPMLPLYTAQVLPPCEMTANEFAFIFTMSHHTKRQMRKSSGSSGTPVVPDDSDMGE